MKSFFRLLLLLILNVTMSACMSTVDITQGIASFRAENYRHAFVRLKPAAIRGNPDAQYAVAYMYYYGLGVIEDRKEAWLWFNRAARLGQPDAVIAVKILTQTPNGPPSERR